VIVAMLAVTSMAGMIAMELGTRRQNVNAKGNSHTADNRAAENRRAENSKHIKSDTLAAGVSGIGALKATEPAANSDSTAVGKLSGDTLAGVNRSSETGAAACFRLELTSPGKEPVQIMRLLHKELGFPADEAKRAILSRKFPLRLAQGKKEVMQEKAKKLLHAGAKLRLTV